MAISGWQNFLEKKNIKKELIEIPEEIIYNKELSDAIRDIVINSACDFDQALRLLNKSKDHTRDVELIKKLKEAAKAAAKEESMLRREDIIESLKAVLEVQEEIGGKSENK